MGFEDNNDGIAAFDELDISGVDSSTALVALTAVDEDDCPWGLAIALLDDEAQQWVVYTTDIDGARRLRDSLKSRIEQLEEMLDNDRDEKD